MLSNWVVDLNALCETGIAVPMNNKARKIDSVLANELESIPGFAGMMAVLTQRNPRRGLALGLAIVRKPTRHETEVVSEQAKQQLGEIPPSGDKPGHSAPANANGYPEIWSAIDKCKSSRRGGGVKGGAAADRSEGTLDAAEHRAIMSVAMALLPLD